MSLSFIEVVPSGRPRDEPMPLVVVMHGRGADAADLADIAPEIDGGRGYRFLFPNAPRPFEAYPGMTLGLSWFDGWPPDRRSIAESRKLVLEFIEVSSQRFATPAGEVVVMGFSQGAMMALDVGFRLATPPAAIVAMSGALYEEEAPPFDRKPSGGVLIVHGTEDPMIPVLAARRSRLVLEEAGINPEYHEFPMGHQVSMESLAVVREFLQRALHEQGS